MFVPKALYENLPFGYFIVSGYLLTFNMTWPMLISAGLFYSAGCVTLVTRSANRRLDKQKQLGITNKLPELLYEYLPFIYGAIGVFTLVITKNSLFQFCAFTLIVLALRNLLCRHNNRNSSAKLF
ncbi:hypothetical protein [Colwellia hornerae]|uniref:Uncharacterized protein n=1 Tax=Colwellia hornerae TaxID=89402 RepID=A0A5C6Q3G0_9GAMM|nr:hypothetical protein [Colwellia hornerae]TWX53331.1 hypothetical protein ESZ28_09765 [Colwellia hornerae]TWX60151.1 hypothetical protein ESZ26_08540 [Colwellia hornerae]TWX63338.1 hypothetical protein ESZ27_17150 [Colwellia hornerae]